MRIVKLLLVVVKIHCCFFVGAQNQQQKNDTIVEQSIFIEKPVDKAAEFPGGRKAMISFFENNIIYPPSAIKDSISGKVRLGFTIEKSGKVKDVRVLKGVRQDLDMEALRVLKLMPIWKPAFLFGKPIQQKFHLPVKFTLPIK